MHRVRGYTVTELMVGVTIIGVLAAASVPNISSYLRAKNTSAGTDQLSSHLRVARSRAVLEGNDYVVQFLDANTYVLIDDDGGGNGLPASPDFTAANRNNGVADEGELTLGPYTLPRDIQFAAVDGSVNPFNGEAITDAISFPEVAGVRAVVFHSNGTADTGGFVALAPGADIAHGGKRTRVLQLLSSTGSVESRAAGH